MALKQAMELAYIGIEASDLTAWQQFATQALGLQALPPQGADQALPLRMDDKAYRWLITPGTADDLAFLGWEYASNADLDTVCARLQAAGHAVEPASPELTAQRQVQRLFITHDPLGNRIELLTGLAQASTPFQSEVLQSHFVTSTGGAGHVVLMEQGQARQPLLDWYGLLGLQLTDVIEQRMAPDFVASVAFLHCNGRHHSLALANMPLPKRIHHLMVESATMQDVGYAHDRCLSQQHPLEMTLGMHPNDQMFSFYVRSPSGFSIEFGWGGLLIDPQQWQPQQLDQLSNWGHYPPAQLAQMLQA